MSRSIFLFGACELWDMVYVLLVCIVCPFGFGKRLYRRPHECGGYRGGGGRIVGRNIQRRTRVFLSVFCAK